MPDQNTDLPEGTDKVIAGASGPAIGASVGAPVAGRSVDNPTEVLVVADEDVAVLQQIDDDEFDDDLDDGGTDTAGSTGGGMIERLRSGRERLSGQAAGRARGFVSQGLERSAETLSNVSRMVGETADGIDDRLGPEYGEYARRAATAIEDAATSLASKDPDELIDDTREFVRRSPGVALAGAAVVGFALARLVKSGLAGVRETSGEDEDDDGGSRGRKTSKADA
jgi:ElaB/YqjD/DUF883 family membrane-anchored ribosome-binding protein